MIIELSSIAFALAGMNPAPLLTPVLAMQDGRMEKFVAAPRGIKIPLGDESGFPWAMNRDSHCLVRDRLGKARP
jgi:hypothetical protein